VPGVANIEEEVLLEIEFVAVPAPTSSPLRLGVAAAKPAPQTSDPQTEVAQTRRTPTPVPSDIALFSIIGEESEVRFSLDEDLRGRRVTVVGTTDQVAGLIEIDRANPANSRMGAVRINMRTLETDNEFRNRAIRSQVLQTSNDDYEFSDFVPRELSGLPSSAEIGESYTFTVLGDLTIKGEPREVEFEVTITTISEDRIEGLAQATIEWREWGISIPNAPGVANIEEEVLLEIEFVAEVE
jgi:polyisoprenoid-binding protein YceI